MSYIRVFTASILWRSARSKDCYCSRTGQNRVRRSKVTSQVHIIYKSTELVHFNCSPSAFFSFSLADDRVGWPNNRLFRKNGLKSDENLKRWHNHKYNTSYRTYASGEFFCGGSYATVTLENLVPLLFGKRVHSRPIIPWFARVLGTEGNEKRFDYTYDVFFFQVCNHFRVVIIPQKSQPKLYRSNISSSRCLEKVSLLYSR